MPLCTSCCMNRCLSSMWFAFLLLPILVAMASPAVLFVWILVITVVVALMASCRKFLTCRASVAPVPIAYSSDSADDSAATACVLEPNCTVGCSCDRYCDACCGLSCSWASRLICIGVDVDLYCFSVVIACVLLVCIRSPPM